jgi:alpha-1,2-mannosyltransferase
MQLLVLATVAALVLVFRALQFAGLTGQVQWGYDFSFYWTAASHLLHGEPIYSATQLAGPYAPQGQDGFLYPPPLAAAVMPLAALFPSDPRAAAWIWNGLGAAILVASLLALHRSERLGERFPLLAGKGRWLLVAAACAFPPVVGELVLGNVHLLLLGLLTLAWLGLRQGEARESRGDSRGEWLAGIAVGLATVIKVFPGLIVIWFLLTRRYRAAAGALVGFAAAALLTLPFTGIKPWLDYPIVLANLSAPADPTDTLAPTVWLAPYLGLPAARILVTLAGVAALAWSALRQPPARSFAVAVTVAVLVAPAVYQHYLALLVLPLVLGLGAGVPIGALAIAYLLMWGGQQDALGDLSWIVNRALPTLGALALLGALATPTGERRWQSAPAPS